ncbi:unnamed protein product [Musa banksii]
MGLINHCVPSGDAYHKALRVACVPQFLRTAKRIKLMLQRSIMTRRIFTQLPSLPHSVLFYLWMDSNQGLSLKGFFGYKDGLASYQQRHGRSYAPGSGWRRRMLWATTEHSRPS